MKAREPKFPEWAGMDDFGGTDFPDIDYSTRLFDSPIVQERFKPGFGDSVDVPVSYVRKDDRDPVAFDVSAAPLRSPKPSKKVKYEDSERFYKRAQKMKAVRSDFLFVAEEYPLSRMFFFGVEKPAKWSLTLEEWYAVLKELGYESHAQDAYSFGLEHPGAVFNFEPRKSETVDAALARISPLVEVRKLDPLALLTDRVSELEREVKMLKERA